MLTLKTKEFFFKHILEKYNYTESDFHQLPLMFKLTKNETPSN